MTPVNKRTLVLNNDYSAHSVIDWDRAVVLMIMNQDDPKEGAYVVEYYANDFIKDSRGHKYPIPAVMVLASYKKRKKNIPFSRKNVWLRDRFTCMYCGKKCKWNELTYDHVIPRCQWDQTKKGTPTHWENIVSCCYPCNRMKAGRTPKQAGMKLIKEPKVPVNAMHIHGFSVFKPIPAEWDQYIPEFYRNIVEKGV